MQVWGGLLCPPWDTELCGSWPPPFSLQRAQLLSELSHHIFIWREREPHRKCVKQPLQASALPSKQVSEQGLLGSQAAGGRGRVAWDLNPQPQNKSLRDPSAPMIQRARRAAVVCFLWILHLSTMRPVLDSCFFPGNR